MVSASRTRFIQSSADPEIEPTLKRNTWKIAHVALICAQLAAQRNTTSVFHTHVYVLISLNTFPSHSSKHSSQSCILLQLHVCFVISVSVWISPLSPDYVPHMICCAVLWAGREEGEEVSGHADEAVGKGKTGARLAVKYCFNYVGVENRVAVWLAVALPSSAC